MTLDQLADEIRRAYDNRDRERMEWALAQIKEKEVPCLLKTNNEQEKPSP